MASICRIHFVATFIMLSLHCSVARCGLIAITGAGNGVNANDESILYELDPLNGSVIREIGDTGLRHITGIAIHPISGLVYAHQSVPFDAGILYTLNMDTALPTLIGTTHLTSPELAFRSDGTLFGWMEFHDSTFGQAVDDVFTLNLATGAATLLGDSGIFPSQTSLAFDSSDNLIVKGLDGGLGPMQLYSVNQATGVATRTIELSANSRNGFAIDSNDDAYAVDRRANTSFLQSIDLATGQVTELGDIGIQGISSIAFTPQAQEAVVPEPSSLLLVAFSFATLATFRRRPRSPSNCLRS